MRRSPLFALTVLALCLGFAGSTSAQDEVRIIEIRYTPVRRAQIAVWVESSDGTFLRTLGLTHSVADRGIGNRPGAAQMNSGFLWPYGRREGVLPVWAHRRAAAPGAELFSRVIFQDRTSEGWASRSTSDFSVDTYFCLSFDSDASSRDNLDAVTCPSRFNSDKGRYLTQNDVERGYAEPFQTAPGSGEMRALALTSLYPPRRDVRRCVGAGCFDHEDVAQYADDVRRVMPEIDAVTMATPPEGETQTLTFTIPDEWPDGDYFAWVEINTEGDYNAAYNPTTFPTPINPSGAWDYWAMNYGYPFRGQPSVVFRIPFSLGGNEIMTGTLDPWGYGALDGQTDALHEMDGTISDDPTTEPGSGADRLFVTDGQRVRVLVIGPEICESNTAPGMIGDLEVREFTERRDAHRYAHLGFTSPDDDLGVTRYEVRVGTEPIVDEASYMRALPARAATLEPQGLTVPTPDAAGTFVEVDFGGLSPETKYFVAVRAVDRCNEAGPMAVVEYTTPAIEFTTVSPCFVATAAYGSPLASQVGTLRRFRDRHLANHALGRAAIALYYAWGPQLADAIRDDEVLRGFARTAIQPLVRLVGAD